VTSFTKPQVHTKQSQEDREKDNRREEEADEGGEEEDALHLELLLLLLLPGYRFHGFCSFCQDTTLSSPVCNSDQHTIVPACKQASKQASKRAIFLSVVRHGSK
jgi:hypothetical protein